MGRLGLDGSRPAVPGIMVSEFDLPCTACGHDLAEATVAGDVAGGPVTVAVCPNCGTRHYPESALEGFKSRR